MDGPTATTAVDSTGTLNATGNSGVTWNGGSLFDPDASFNSTSGVLTSKAALAANNDFHHLDMGPADRQQPVRAFPGRDDRGRLRAVRAAPSATVAAEADRAALAAT